MSQTNWLRVRDEVRDLLKQVAGVTVVHGYPRLEKDMQITRWRSLLSDKRRINAWTILRVSTDPSFLTCNEVKVITNILLVGVLEHNDEAVTQDEFDETIDLVLETFYSNYRLLGSVDIQGPAVLQLEELRQVANTPVHYAEIAIQAQQRVHFSQVK